MSSVYTSEPNPNGKVILSTTHGPLSIELWGKECPQASRNFIQLCLEGYYDGSTFHRIVPGFCVQGGRCGGAGYEDEYSTDLEASEGAAAISPDGRFGVENHSRLRFNRRGLIGMANLDAQSLKSCHGSQFFFTLSEASELAGKSTLFGRLVGDSIFNLLRMGELEIDSKTEAPLYPPKIVSTQVVLNPFNDLVPRDRRIKPSIVSMQKPAVASKRNKALLSFEAEYDEAVVNADVKTVPVSQSPKSVPAAPSASSSLDFLQKMKEIHRKETQKKIEAMEIELGLRPQPRAAVDPPSPTPQAPQKLSALERHRQKYLQNGVGTAAKRRPDSKDEMDTLLLLNSFRQKIQKKEKGGNDEEEGEDCKSKESPSEGPTHLDICKLHGLVNCLSCRDTFGISLNANEEIDEKGWMMHKLVFDRQELDKSIRRDLNQLVVIDPREQAAKLKLKKK